MAYTLVSGIPFPVNLLSRGSFKRLGSRFVRCFPPYQYPMEPFFSVRMALALDVIYIGSVRTLLTFVPARLPLHDKCVSRVFGQFYDFLSRCWLDLFGRFVMILEELLGIDDSFTKIVYAQLLEGRGDFLREIRRGSRNVLWLAHGFISQPSPYMSRYQGHLRGRISPPVASLKNNHRVVVKYS